jgi:hypothetical protein
VEEDSMAERRWRDRSAGGGNAVLAILKGLVWPAFVVYDLLRHLAG